TDVVQVVERALRSAPIPGVAPEAPISCVLMDLGESWARYAVRYWLADLVNDDPTDGEIRTRIWFALRRAGIPLSLPPRAVLVTDDNAGRREHKETQALERRRRVLDALELFSQIPPDARAALAARMHPAPFARGEVVHREGAEAHWLYVLVAGEVEERVA